MITFTGRRRRPHREPIVPLINVVFLLLIFFMLVGSVRPSEPLAVELPRAAAGKEPGRDGRVLYLGADGALGASSFAPTDGPRPGSCCPWSSVCARRACRSSSW